MRKLLTRTKLLIPQELIENKILLVRGRKVMIDRDLAAMYGVETRVLNQAVRRNIDRFPADFMFSLTRQEINNLSQIVISSKINRSLSAVFTRLCQKAPPFTVGTLISKSQSLAFGGNGQASLDGDPQSMTTAGSKCGFGEVPCRYDSFNLLPSSLAKYLCLSPLLFNEPYTSLTDNTGYTFLIRQETGRYVKSSFRMCKAGEAEKRCIK